MSSFLLISWGEIFFFNAKKEKIGAWVIYQHCPQVAATPSAHAKKALPKVYLPALFLSLESFPIIISL